MESPVGIVEAYHLALCPPSLFLEHDRGTHLTAKAAYAGRSVAAAHLVAASRAWFVVEVVHI